jgi:hypothetical protein
MRLLQKSFCHPEPREGPRTQEFFPDFLKPGLKIPAEENEIKWRSAALGGSAAARP